MKKFQTRAIIDYITKAKHISKSEALKKSVWIIIKKEFITKLGMVPSIVDQVNLYYDNNKVIAQDPNLYLGNYIWL